MHVLLHITDKSLTNKQITRKIISLCIIISICVSCNVVSIYCFTFIFKVNDISFREATLADAVRCIKETPSPVRLIILRENPQALFTTNESTCWGSRQDLIISRYFFLIFFISHCRILFCNYNFDPK